MGLLLGGHVQPTEKKTVAFPDAEFYAEHFEKKKEKKKKRKKIHIYISKR